MVIDAKEFLLTQEKRKIGLFAPDAMVWGVLSVSLQVTFMMTDYISCLYERN